MSDACITIVDSGNICKSHRYQLYCEAQAVSTTSVVLWTNVSVETALKWNSEQEGDKYTQEQVRDQANRFERPNADDRWDKPLLIVGEGERTPLREIEARLKGEKGIQRGMPNVAVIPQVAASSGVVFDVDRVCSDIIAAILKWQNESLGSHAVLPHTDVKLVLYRKVTASELRRLKRAYLGLTQVRVPKDSKEAGDSFALFIREQL